MSTIVTRSGKGSPLTWTEVDANFTNLNTDKLQSGNTAAALTITSATINGGTINGTTIGATTSSSGDFTALSASSTVSGTGFSTYLASPPAIGGITASTGKFTSLTSTALTSGRVTYAGTSGLLQDSANLNFDGTNLLVGGTTSRSRLTVSGGINSTDSIITINNTLNSGAWVAGDVLGGVSFYTSDVTGIGAHEVAFIGAVNGGSNVASPDGVLVFKTGQYNNASTERMRIDSLGNVGIGTASPQLSLDVTINNSTAYTSTSSSSSFPAGGNIYITNASTGTAGTTAIQGFYTAQGGTQWYQGAISASTSYAGSFVIGNRTGSTAYAERMRIDSSGNVGIGAASSSDKLEVSGTGTTYITAIRTSANTSRMSMGAGSGVGVIVASDNAGNAVPITFYTGLTEKMRLDASGNLGLGVTPSAWATYKALQMGATTPFALDSSGAIGLNYYYDGAYKYFGTSAATLYSVAAGQHRWYTAPSGTAGTAITFTQAMTLDASGRLLVGLTSANTSGAKLQTVDGITFPATQVASADANTLDDYEEGTFTPTVSYTTAGTLSVTYSNQRGYYTKIGNLVTVNIFIQLSAFTKGTATGDLLLAGLPFTSQNINENRAVSSVGFFNCPTSTTAGNFPFGYIASNTSSIIVAYSTNNAGTTTVDPDANSQIFTTITYRV